jgi:hypothetical protein
MSKLLTLATEFPHLYALPEGVDKRQYPFHAYATPQFQCREGWYDLLHLLSGRLEPLVLVQPAEKRLLVVQVKQKFGTLRYYVRNATVTMKELIAEAEYDSAKICERCGAPGKTAAGDRSGIETNCSTCFDERQNWGKALT